ncbi:periplasmic nitrate reductase, NapE protein [Hyphomicrobium sp.]|uniref:periplasmic nitrate reductase, NapE protein n=1 Tax=Hyphomicrobium sp. TaxID=82 RepID=UPI002CA50F71|nr:periplasmic nitrate reductase, NapE protein [Hyphomicrobium sp.]HRN88617.1 periplasmic nitrate reductase, NapE protein [Hyphomicrobium sp.]HRQ25747.1 periplasmic nitrate reductase, NapE protein [Hyphomicrobium sp.]
MESERGQTTSGGDQSPLVERRSELSVFFLLAVIIWPIISVALIGGYGFLVWMWQIVFGPPGPPG